MAIQSVLRDINVVQFRVNGFVVLAMAKRFHHVLVMNKGLLEALAKSFVLKDVLILLNVIH